VGPGTGCLDAVTLLVVVAGATERIRLTIDHRAIDGVPAAQFLGTVRDLLESPLRMVAR
jgi:pyruvate/2-oxoglutarate dehydrogenase complex dihydrolipoamide acyltransferase (E2) component